MKSPGHVVSVVTNSRLVEQRRGQILRAAVKLFSEKGYYVVTVQQIARKAGISMGLIYQYFGDKDDILFLALRLVLETYENEIPPQLVGVEHPLERLCTALRAYCTIVDRLRDATVLAYRSTKSLRADRRHLIKEKEINTNRLLEGYLRPCIAEGYVRPVDEFLLVYQFTHFCHAWALKHWAFRDRFTLEEYLVGGMALLIEPFLTEKGRENFDKLGLGTAEFAGRQLEVKPPAVAKRRAR
ncbi:MAG TPA: TetR/AcrR family transcriptional regulator [Burkholderiales bacterium]|nr:TetR/AcrR family transcriptional regulator [Burkholderiales bacterium]